MGLVVEPIVKVVLGVVILVALLVLIVKIREFGASIPNILPWEQESIGGSERWVSQKAVEDFKAKASTLEEAIACSLMICKEGCGRVMNWGSLSWTNTSGDRVTCSDVCQKLPIGERGENFCDLDSAEFSINVKVKGDELNVNDFKILFGKIVDDVCVVTEKTEFKKLPRAKKANLIYIYTNSSNLAKTVKPTRCEVLETEEKLEKRGVAVGKVKDGDYHVFVFGEKPPNLLSIPPLLSPEERFVKKLEPKFTVGIEFLTVCISRASPGDVRRSKDYSSKIRDTCLAFPGDISPSVESSCLCKYLN